MRAALENGERALSTNAGVVSAGGVARGADAWCLQAVCAPKCRQPMRTTTTTTTYYDYFSSVTTTTVLESDIVTSCKRGRAIV